MYDSILVPTDGSVGSEKAIDRAIDVAKHYNADLHVVHVVDTRIGIEGGAGTLLDELEAAGRDAIDRGVETATAADVSTVEGAVANGIPFRAILDYTEENDIDLVVMGTHGRTGLDRYLLGSVTEKVVRMSDVPVLTVPLREDDEE